MGHVRGEIGYLVCQYYIYICIVIGSYYIAEQQSMPTTGGSSLAPTGCKVSRGIRLGRVLFGRMNHTFAQAK